MDIHQTFLIDFETNSNSLNMIIDYKISAILAETNFDHI